MARNKYCTGCGELFAKTHLMHHHRRTMRCGGRFLPEPIRNRLNLLRKRREAEARIARNEQDKGRDRFHPKVSG